MMLKAWTAMALVPMTGRLPPERLKQVGGVPLSYLGLVRETPTWAPLNQTLATSSAPTQILAPETVQDWAREIPVPIPQHAKQAARNTPPFLGLPIRANAFMRKLSGFFHFQAGTYTA